MSDFSLSGEITGDASGFLGAIQQATESLNGFAEVAAGVFAGAGAEELFSTFTTGVGNMVGSIVGTASDFQSYGATISNSLANVADSADSSSDTVVGGNAKAAASALEAQDAFVKYQEKIKEINDNIATVMQGTNITDAVNTYEQKLEDAQQSYAEKVASINQQIQSATDTMNQTISDKQQSMQNSLADMQSAHENKMADTQEKQAIEIANAKTQIEKETLQKKFAEENQLEVDSYNRAYALKQQQEQRNLDEATAKAKEQADKKIATYQAELQKEAEAEQDKETKLKAQEEKELARLETENAKKLAMYQRELADEERSYELSQAKRAAGGGGGGAGRRSEFGFGPLSATKEGEGFFTDINETAQQLEGHLVNIAATQPFRLHDIEEAAQGMTALGMNVERTEPIVADLAGKFHTTLGTAMQAVQDEMAGNGRMMETTFHITKDQIQKAFGPGQIKSVDDFMNAMEKLDTKGAKLSGSFAGDAKVLMGTLPGMTSNVQDQFDKVFLSFMGLNTSAEHFGDIEKGGLFDLMLKGLTNLSSYLQKNHVQIEDFAKKAGESVAKIVDAFQKFFGFIESHWGVIKIALETIGIVLAGIAAANVVTGIMGVVAAISAFTDILAAAYVVAGAVPVVMTLIGTAIAAIGGPITLIGIAIAALAFLIITHWTQVKDFTLTAWRDMGNAWNASMKAIGDGIKGFVDNSIKVFKEFSDWLGGWMKEIGNWFNEQTTNFYNWGKNLATTFVNGIKDILKNVGSILTGPIESAFKMFKGKSPPEEGPLREIDTWGFNIGMAWVGGFQQAIKGVNMPALSGGVGGFGGTNGSVGNYNSGNVSTTNLTLNNTFNTNSAATANMSAEYLGFMLEQRGIV